MTVDEIFTKFSFKADTGKAQKFAKTTEKIKDSMRNADSAWTRFNSKLSQGFNSKWFNTFSSKVTDMRRVQLFMNGIRRGMDMIGKVVPGFSKLSGAFTNIAQGYNKFTTQMVRARSAFKSFGTILQNTATGILPMVRAKLQNLSTVLRTGFTKALTWIKGLNWGAIWIKMKAGFAKGLVVAKKALLKLGSLFAKGFKKLQTVLQNSNSKLGKGIGNMFSGLSSRFKGFKGLAAFGNKIKGLTANVPGLGKLTSAFSAMGLGATAALAGIVVGVIAVIKIVGALIKAVKKATEDFIKFEEGMKGVARVTLASAEEMGELEDAALAAGEASVFGVTDAANAMKFLAMAGLETNEVIGALPGTLQLAAAGEMDLAMAADIATNIMSSNALEVEDLARINDVLAFSASNSNQSVQELGSAIKNVGPTARLAGISVEQMSGWLAVLANNGLKGQEAGTMVRNAIMDLVNPTKKMTAALKVGGVAIEDFIDETGKVSNIEDLLKALENMSDASKKTFLGALDARTYRALAPIITGSVDAMKEFNVELENAEGTAAAMAAIAFEGLDGAIKEFHSKMETANVKFIRDSSLGTFFEEVVRVGTSVLPGLISMIAGIIKPVGMILTIVMKVVRIFTTVLGGVFKTIGTALKGFWTLMQNVIAPILGLFDRISLGFSRISDAVNDTNRGPLSMMLNIFSKIGTIIGGLFKAIIWAINPLLEVIDILLNVFLIILPNAINNVADLIGGKLMEKFDSVKDFFASLGKVDTSESATSFSSASTAPFSGGAPTSSISVGDVNNNVTVTGGMTNEETGAVVAAETEAATGRALRELLLEGL